MRQYFLLIIFLIAVHLVSAQTIECFDDGSISVKGLEKKKGISASDLLGNEFSVSGLYTYNEESKEYNFYSDEALFVSKNGARFFVDTGKNRISVACPPFKFSCRIFNITIDYCYNRDNVFTSKFMVHNFHFTKTDVLRFTKPHMLKYEITTEDNLKLVQSPDILSSELENTNISLRKLNSGNKFVYSWPTEKKAKKFAVIYDKCSSEKYNVYQSVQCTEATTCTIDKDCFEDEYCEEWTCKKLDCTGCQYIEDHLCIGYLCCADEDCLPRESCEEHMCVDVDCKDNERVYDHACRQLHCETHEIAINHTCQALDCADDESAVNHTCQKLNCAGNEIVGNHTCQRLDCGVFQKAHDHSCVGYFAYLYAKLLG